MAEDTWGANLRRLREARDWSMDQLAAACVPATTGSQINKLEKGIVQMTEAWVGRLARALGVNRLDIIEPVAKLEPRERALVDGFRGLNEPNRDTVFRVVDALPKPPLSRRHRP